MKQKAFALAVAAMIAPAWAEENQPGGHFVENWDLDGDGSVTVVEIETRRGDVFYSFDADENGTLGATEYAVFDEARANDMRNEAGHGQGGGMKRAAEGMTLAFNDTDGNGAVSREEFLARSADWLALLDRNGDGSVTSADFGRQ